MTTLTAAQVRARLLPPDQVLESEYRAVHDLLLDAVASWEPTADENIATFVTEVLNATASSVLAIAPRLGLTLDPGPLAHTAPLVIDAAEGTYDMRLRVTVTDSGMLRYSLGGSNGIALNLSYLLHDVRDQKALPVFATPGWRDEVVRIVRAARGITVHAVHTPQGVTS